MPALGTVLPSGQQEQTWLWLAANDFRRSPTVDEDSESHRLTWFVRRTAKSGLESWVELSAIARNGGFLDPIIDGWHSTVLGWNDPVRNSTKMGRSVVRPGAGNGTYGSAFEIGDATYGLGKQLGSWSVRGAIKAPIGNPNSLLGSGGLDLGLSAEREISMSRQVSLHLMAGLVWQGPAPRMNERRWVDQELVALVWKPNSRDRWIVQWQSEGAPVRTGDPIADGPHRIISFGYRRKTGKDQHLELFFSEDKDLFNGRIPLLAHVGPDFQAGIRYTVRR